MYSGGPFARATCFLWFCFRTCFACVLSYKKKIRFSVFALTGFGPAPRKIRTPGRCSRPPGRSGRLEDAAGRPRIQWGQVLRVLMFQACMRGRVMQPIYMRVRSSAGGMRYSPICAHMMQPICIGDAAMMCRWNVRMMRCDYI